MPEFPETDHSLIDRAKDTADGASWLEFVGIYQPVVYRLARRRGLQDADSLDVVQHVFASIARSLDGWSLLAHLLKNESRHFHKPIIQCLSS